MANARTFKIRDIIWKWLEDTTSYSALCSTRKRDEKDLPTGNYECFPNLEELCTRLEAEAAATQALRERVEELEGHLTDACRIVEECVGEGDLGISGDQSTGETWPVRDEYVGRWRAALKNTETKGEANG